MHLNLNESFLVSGKQIQIFIIPKQFFLKTATAKTLITQRVYLNSGLFKHEFHPFLVSVVNALL